MSNLNRVILTGNLTRDPEVKYTPKGTAIAAFGLAVNRAYKTEAGEKREETTFLDLEAYAKLAEIIGEYCRKGKKILVEGRLKLDQWDDRQTGQKRSKVKIVVETMEFLGGTDRESGDDSAAEPPPRRQPPRSGPPKTRPTERDPILDREHEDEIPF